VVLGCHYPSYCSWGSGYKTCTTPPLPPSGYPETTGVLAVDSDRMRRALEPLMIKYRVHFYLSGHVHNYERTHPVNDLRVMSRERCVHMLQYYNAAEHTL
jgi:hypothetical protein